MASGEYDAPPCLDPSRQGREDEVKDRRHFVSEKLVVERYRNSKH